MWVGVILLALYLLLAAAATQILHFSRALDEGYHLDLTLFIKETQRLPVTFDERAQMARADLPPLYHLLVALAAAGVDTTSPGQPVFKLFRDSFRYQAIDFGGDTPWSLDTEDLTPPYAGQFLVWQVGRWLSVGLGVLTLLVVFVALQAIPLGQHPLTSLFGAAFLAFLPRFLLVTAALNDDSLLALTAALYFLLLVLLIKSPGRWWPALLLGAVLGISITVKYSLALMPFEIAVVLALLARRQRLGWRWFAGRLAAIGLLAMLFSSWWFGWNIWHFNTVAQDGLVPGVTRALLSGGYNATLNEIGAAVGGETLAAIPPDEFQQGTLNQWLQVTFTSFWGYAVDDRIPLSPGVFWAAGGLLLAAAIGLWRLWRGTPASRRWIALAAGHTALLVVIPLVRFATSGRIGQTAQGRHILIPAATAIVALLAWGIAEITPRRWRMPLFAAITAALIGWTGLHLLQILENAASLLPMRTLAQAAEWLPNRVDAQFGREQQIELVGYRLTPQPAQSQLAVELAWRSRAAVNENYRPRVTLLDEAGRPVSVWEGHPGAGRLPTLAWDPGDVVFDRLKLPLHNLPAGNYTAQVELMGANGQPQPVLHNGAEQTALTLDAVSLAEASASVANEAGLRVWRPEEGALRYPGTLVILADDPAAAVELVDPDGALWLADAAANGVFNFVVGPRWPGGEYGINRNGQPTGQTVTVDNWWPRRFTLPDGIETPLAADFAQQVHLLGYSLPQKQVRAGEAFPVTIYWQAPADKSPQANFIQFNNLLDSDGQLRGGYERLPLENYSTLFWAPGEVVVDGYAVPVDADAPPGEYWLDVGLYLTVGEAAINLPLVVDGQRTEVSSVTLGPIEVVGP
ncbi:MAG: hypothetical protein Kow0031_15200 [Anaerolineae bacterium]